MDSIPFSILKIESKSQLDSRAASILKITSLHRRLLQLNLNIRTRPQPSIRLAAGLKGFDQKLLALAW